MENNIAKINLWKKIWYSITKPSKYKEMSEQGLGSSIKYFLVILLICSIIIAIFSTTMQLSVINNAISHLDEKIPEMKFKDNQLSIESKNATILSEEEFKQYFGTIIVLDTSIKEEDAIKKYTELATDKYNVTIFLKDEYVILKQDSTEKHKYADVSSKFIKDSSIEYNKSSIISYSKERTTSTYYFGTFFAYYFFALGITYISYILIISLSIWIINKFLKIKWTFKHSFINTIYSSTLALFVHLAYMIINYFTKFQISFMDVIIIILIYIYISIILAKDKKELDS